MKWFLLALTILILKTSALSLDREAFIFTKYNLDIQIDPEQQRLEVRGSIVVRNDSDMPQKNIPLQISSSLNWISIRIAGKAADFIAQPYTSDIDHTGGLSEAIMTLPQAVPPKGSIEMEVGYEGTIPLDATRLTSLRIPKRISEQSDWDEIGKKFTAVRGIGYVTWYPIATEAADLSDKDAVFETIARWKRREAQSEMYVNLHFTQENSDEAPRLLCGGQKTNQTTEQIGPAQLVTIACAYSPVRLAVPSFALGRYSALERPEIDIYYLAEHKAAAENYALAAELEVPFVTEWFGAPRLKAEVVELAGDRSSPFESEASLFTPLVSDDSTKYTLAVVHQLTHAAFLSPRLWIYEGLAHFAQAVAVENKSGRQAALDFIGVHLASIAAAEKSAMEKHDPNGEAAESLINTDAEEFYRSKAMYVWWMLRDLVGDQALKKSLAAYRPNEDKDPSYMPRLIQAQTKRDLEWFFDDWVYRDHGLPDFRVQSAYPRKLVSGGYMVTITVENLGNAGAEVPLILKMEGGEIRKLLEVHAKSKASIRIESATTPQEIILNDGIVPESDVSNNTYKIVLPQS
jgi:hypothetical protein